MFHMDAYFVLRLFIPAMKWREVFNGDLRLVRLAGFETASKIVVFILLRFGAVAAWIHRFK